MPRKVVGLEQAGLKRHCPLHIIPFSSISVHTKRKSLTLTEFIPSLPPSSPIPTHPAPMSVLFLSKVCTPREICWPQLNTFPQHPARLGFFHILSTLAYLQSSVLTTNTHHLLSSPISFSIIMNVPRLTYQPPSSILANALFQREASMAGPFGVPACRPNGKCSKCPFPKRGVHGRTFWSPSMQTQQEV